MSALGHRPGIFPLISFTIYFYEGSNAFCQPHASSVSHQHLRCQEELSRNDGTPSSFFTHFHGENHHQPWNLVGPQKTELSPWDLVSGGCWCGMGQVVARVKGTPFCPFLGAMVSWKNVCRSKKSRSPCAPPATTSQRNSAGRWLSLGGMMIQGLAAFFFGTKEEYGSWISFFPEKNSHVLHNIPYLRPLTSRLS